MIILYSIQVVYFVQALTTFPAHREKSILLDAENPKVYYFLFDRSTIITLSFGKHAKSSGEFYHELYIVIGHKYTVSGTLH